MSERAYALLCGLRKSFDRLTVSANYLENHITVDLYDRMRADLEELYGLSVRSYDPCAANYKEMYEALKARVGTHVPALPLFPDEVEAIANGEKIQAIKLLRARTNLGLKEAKDFIESR